MVIFPTIVYKCPGNHKRPGGTFDIKPIKDEIELDDAIDNGWFESLVDAINNYDNPPKHKYIRRAKK